MKEQTSIVQTVLDLQYHLEQFLINESIELFIPYCEDPRDMKLEYTLDRRGSRTAKSDIQTADRLNSPCTR